MLYLMYVDFTSRNDEDSIRLLQMFFAADLENRQEILLELIERRIKCKNFREAYDEITSHLAYSPFNHNSHLLARGAMLAHYFYDHDNTRKKDFYLKQAITFYQKALDNLEKTSDVFEDDKSRWMSSLEKLKSHVPVEKEQDYE
ncbi:hypothetical protein O9G_002646 [Rozella allomycis CSF55]|uniref:Uncharacterized protein n=1 Tax=Rozella allomycis (strain CSF55) TaxID=988480 RepID=A0A075B3W7_ROZAC|nr:hypothetical protein O9G_002646 [Rozella allomycis CSF55]|eukprot:EPZ35638.1 hypothetical protein O9G_002646 [Rozella allomycis CSF55]